MRVFYNGTIWTRERIRSLLDRNDAAVYRAITLVQSKQTVAERDSHSAQDENSVGWSKYDAKFMSAMAEIVAEHGHLLTEKQIETSRRVIKKYWRQALLDVAAKPGAEVLVGRLSAAKKAELAARPRVSPKGRELNEKPSQGAYSAVELKAMQEQRELIRKRPSRRRAVEL